MFLIETTSHKFQTEHCYSTCLPPRPSHFLQMTFLCKASFLIVPLYKSSNETLSKKTQYSRIQYIKAGGIGVGTWGGRGAPCVQPPKICDEGAHLPPKELVPYLTPVIHCLQDFYLQLMDHIPADIPSLAIRPRTKEHIKDVHRVVKSTTGAPLLQGLFTTLVIQFTFLLIRQDFVCMGDGFELQVRKSLS